MMKSRFLILLISLLAPSLSHAYSIKRVQTANDNLANTGLFVTTVTINASTNHNLLTVLVTAEPTNNSVSRVTDNVGNTYVQVPGAFSSTGAGFMTDIWYAQNAIPGATVIVTSMTLATPGEFGCAVIEYSGVRMVAPFSFSGAFNSNSSVPPMGPSLTNTDADSIFISFTNPASISFTGVNPPWNDLTFHGVSMADYLPGTITTAQAIIQPTTAQLFAGSGVVFLSGRDQVNIRGGEVNIMRGQVTIK